MRCEEVTSLLIWFSESSLWDMQHTDWSKTIRLNNNEKEKNQNGFVGIRWYFNLMGEREREKMSFHIKRGQEVKTSFNFSFYKKRAPNLIQEVREKPRIWMRKQQMNFLLFSPSIYWSVCWIQNHYVRNIAAPIALNWNIC